MLITYPLTAGGGHRTCQPMSPSLGLVGAVASHMSVQVNNPHDSDGAHRAEPVLSLPPAVILNAMVDPDGDCTYMPGSPSGDRTLSPVMPVSPPGRTDMPLPANVEIMDTSVANAADETQAGGRIAAVKRMLAPEAEARYRSFEEAEERKQQLHTLRRKLLRGKLIVQTRQWKHQDQKNKIELEFERKKKEIELEHQAKKNRMEIEMLEIEKKIKEQQLAAFVKKASSN